MEAGLVLGVIGIGIVHGVLPDHGWPIAATYALEFRRRWLRGTVAALILGIGHLVSSVVLVLAYFWFSSFAAFAEGPWMRTVAGVVLVGLGVYTYVSGGHAGHDHGAGGHHDDSGDDHHHGDGEHDHHDHGHARDEGDEHVHGIDHGHQHDGEGHVHGDEHDHHHDDHHDDGILGAARARLPDGGHAHLSEDHAQEGLATLGATALLLGFAHEEPIQILAICAGTAYCLELMLIYSLAVIAAILAPTLLLIAGYERHRDRIERYTPYLPTLTAVVLVAMGLWFLLGGH